MLLIKFSQNCIRFVQYCYFFIFSSAMRHDSVQENYPVLATVEEGCLKVGLDGQRMCTIA
jgi:hypothetical protein